MRNPAVERRGSGRWFIWAAGLAAALMMLAAAPPAGASTAALGSEAPRSLAPRLVPPGRGLAARFGPSRLESARFAGGSQALTPHGNLAQTGRAGASVVLDGSPGSPAANPATDTVYVPIQCATSFCPSQNGHTVDVINAAKCNAEVSSDCRVVARASVGSSPLAVAVDQETDTVYVTNGNDGTVSVLNGARCDATVTSGCGQPVATVRAGKFPVAAAFNPATHTLYVANLGGGISVINVAACNALTISGCGQPARTVTDSAGPSWIDINVATDAVYVANVPPSGHGTVSVINGAACNGHTGRGCGKVPATVTVGVNPSALAVDQANDTVYVANFANESSGGSVSVINGARCNGKTTAGCGQTPPAVPTGIGTGFVAVDQALHTVFALNAGDDTLSAINTRTCDGAVTSGCRRRPPNQKAAPDQGPGYDGFPNGFALMQATGTAYLMNAGGANVLTVTGISRCTASNTSGCRAEAPTVHAPGDGFLVSADPATNTIYAANDNRPQIDVLNGATCRAGNLAGCAPVAKIPMAHPFANIGTVDDTTHTLYASDPFSDTVSVINTATCNAENTSGCAHPAPTIKVGPGPGPPALNPVTRTLYVPDGASGNQVAVVNAATCNAIDTSGCGQAPGVVKVGQCTFTLAVSAATDTVYAPSAGSVASGCTDGDTVSVINGAACKGTDHSGCGHLAATARVGLRPVGAAVDDSTHTVYVINNANGDTPGTASVINGATCNGTDTAGCGGHFPVVPTGRSPLAVTVDPGTGFVYVADFDSAAVSVLNGSRCNAETTAGCRAAARDQPIGSGPQGIALNQRTHTIYVADLYLQGSISIFRAAGH